MALTKETVVDKIEVLENGVVQVRAASYILEDGVRITDPRFVRTSLEPSATLPTGVGARVRAVCQAVWTQAVIDAYKAAQVAGK